MGMGGREQVGERQRAGLDTFLRRFLVVPYDADLAKVWARVSAHCKRQGRRIDAADAWVIATAVSRELPLLTHDRDHIGLAVPGLETISYVQESAV
jgi:tRNA(fMet)-specific endonuclease VapC